MAQASINHVNLQGNVMLAQLPGGTKNPGSPDFGLVDAISAAAGPCESSRMPLASLQPLDRTCALFVLSRTVCSSRITSHSLLQLKPARRSQAVSTSRC